MKLGLSGRLLRSVVALSLPTAVVVALGVYFLCHKISLVSMTSSILFTILCIVNHAQRPWLWLFALLCSLVVIVRHRENIKRLIAGTEGTINY